MSDQQRARLGVLLANFFFGTSVVAVKHITPALIQPLALTVVRISSATFLLWAMFVIKPQKTGIEKKDYLVLFFCAIAGIVMNQSFTMWGMSLTSPVHASLLILTTPITITILAAIFLKEKLTILKIAGLLLGISGGAVLVFSRDISSHAAGNQSLGDLFVIIGAMSYSTYVILVRPLIAKYKAVHILQWVFLFGCIITVPLGWKELANANWQHFDAVSWFALVYVVLGATFLAYLLMNYGILKLGPAITGSFIYTQPFFATIASVLLLNEKITLSKLIAALLIISGVFLANSKFKSQNSKEKAQSAADS